MTDSVIGFFLGAVCGFLLNIYLKIKIQSAQREEKCDSSMSVCPHHALSSCKSKPTEQKTKQEYEELL